MVLVQGINDLCRACVEYMFIQKPYRAEYNISQFSKNLDSLLQNIFQEFSRTFLKMENTLDSFKLRNIPNVK